jgi:hypothetical protein
MRRQTSPFVPSAQGGTTQSDQASIASALKAIRCLLRLSTTGWKKCPDRETFVGAKGSDDTFRGRRKDVSAYNLCPCWAEFCDRHHLLRSIRIDPIFIPAGFAA